MDQPSIFRRSFYPVSYAANILRQFPLDPSSEYCVLNIVSFQFVIQHFGFRMGRQIIGPIGNFLPDSPNCRHAADAKLIRQLG